MLGHTKIEWTIRQRLVVGFLSVVMMFGVLMVFQIREIGQVNEVGKILYEQNYQKAELAYEADINLLRINQALLNSFLAVDAVVVEEQEQIIAEQEKELEKNLKGFRALAIPSQISLIEVLESKDRELVQTMKETLELVEAGRIDEAKEMNRTTVRPIIDRFNEDILKLIENVDERSVIRYNEAKATYEDFIKFSLIGLALVTMTAIAIAQLISRNVSKRVGRSTSEMILSSSELASVSSRLRSNSQMTAAQSTQVASAAEEVCANVSTMAAAMEEMTASVREIARSAGEASSVAENAVGVAAHTNATVSKLGDSSAEIGEVIAAITSIAEQTNLLALNATIEAARAGEAGKGFAVVANEVKELAKETAKATEDITGKIASIQADTGGAVDAIGEISSIITQISDIQSSIVTAVEEQLTTTNEVARSVSSAAVGSSEIAESIVNVADAAHMTSLGAGSIQDAATVIASMAHHLEALVGSIKKVGSPRNTSAIGRLKGKPNEARKGDDKPALVK
ncbi:MAG: HAMP domain-containing methyl-accepting chemotaxis protein [Acidimicrobiales bacterium]